MKNCLIFIAAVSVFALCSTTSWSMDYAGVRNPIGPSTVPPSSISSGLVSTPDPIDTTGNLLITGNVRRGKHFRGTVPYRSTTSFGSALGSTSLSSFLRDSAGSEDIGAYSGKYQTQPYYYPPATVSTTIPGRSGVFRPTSTRIGRRVQDVYGLDPLPKARAGQSAAEIDSGLPVPQIQYGTSGDVSQVEPQSMLLSPRSSQTVISRSGEKSVVERFREQLEKSRARLGLETEQDLSAKGQPTQSKSDDSLKLLQEDQVSGRSQTVDFSRPGSAEDELKMRTPAESATGGERASAADYQLPTLDDYIRAAEAAEREEAVRQERPDFSSTRKESQADQRRPTPGALDTLGRYDVGSRHELSTGSTATGTDRERDQADTLERVRQQLDVLTKSLDERLQAERGDTAEGRNTETLAKQEETPSASWRYRPDADEVSRLYALQGIDPSLGPGGLADAIAEAELGQAGRTEQEARRAPIGRTLTPDSQRMGGYESLEERSSPLQELKELSQAELSAEAKRIMGSYETLESFSEAKFRQYMLAADDYLKAGRYYRAAEAFGLASFYRPDSPRALAGKGHALFAAGEYVSSALFLARALAISPEYAQTKIDLTANVGGEVKLAGRTANVEEWLARSGSSELQFLLGYVHFRAGKLSQAKQAIDAAYERMPESPAVQALKTAIDDASKSR